MECICIRHTDLPHTTRLFADFLYHFDRVARFYPHSPHDKEAWPAAAARIQFPDERRAALIEALRIQNADSESLRRLARPGAVAVVTGQQVGLFSGHAYTIYKALTAVKVARELTSRGVEAVPVFWLATEDHDFAEVDQFWGFTPQHQPFELQIPEEEIAAVSGQPVGELAFRHYPVDALRRALEDFPFGREVADLAAESYAPGVSFGAAFTALLKRILPDYGLLYVDPMLPQIRELAAPSIRAALAAAPELTAALLERNRELAEAGYHAQVHVEDHTSLVFLLEGGRRIALKRKNGEYTANGRRISTEYLMDRAASLSPNALLRPVAQDTILPTLAYIGGPAELAYLAQSQVIYERILGRMPVALSRAGFTLFDEKAAKLMRRYQLCLPDFFHGEERLRERIAARLVPPGLARAMAETHSATAAALDRLTGALEGFDPTLAAAMSNNRKKIEYQLSKIERKVERESLARDRRASSAASYLNGLVYPNKHLQERMYSILPFLARHGLDLVDRIYENIHLDCPDHRLLTV